MYGTLMGVSNASPSLAFGQVVRGSDDMAKPNDGHLSSSGAGDCRSPTFAGTVPEKRLRRRTSVKTKVFGHETKALKNLKTVSTVISKQVRNNLNPEAGRAWAASTIADGQLVCSTEAVQKVLVSFIQQSLIVDFYNSKSPPSHVISGVPALEANKECLHYQLQQVILVLGSKNATILFEDAVVKGPVDESLETNSKKFNSDSHAAPKVDDIFGEYLLAGLDEGLHLCEVDYSAFTFYDSEQEVSASKRKKRYLHSCTQEAFPYLLKTSNVAAWSPRDLFSTLVSVNQYFQLTDNSSSHHPRCRKALKRTEYSRKKLETSWDAGTFFPASVFWSVPVAIPICATRYES